MTTIERLDGWKAGGIISDAQHVTLAALVRRERFSLFVELNALLYLGVLSVVGGLTWTFREYVTSLGDAAILSILLVLMAAAFGYCFSRTAPYSNAEVESPSLAFDYVLYFGCLIFSTTLAFVETRFNLFQGWETHLLIASLVFGGLAYRFDNRLVLSLALSTFASYLGLTIASPDDLRINGLRLAALVYGWVLLAVGLLLHRFDIKRHFLDVYLHLGANAILLALVSGVLEPAIGLAYLAALAVCVAASIYLGIRFQKFAFVAYGTLYGYAALSARLLEWVSGTMGPFLYFIFTGTLVVIALVAMARKFGRDE